MRGAEWKIAKSICWSAFGNVILLIDLEVADGTEIDSGYYFPTESQRRTLVY